MTTRLKLYLLGPFETTLDDASLNGFRSDRVRALLSYLVVEGQQHHQREHLASLLWGEFLEKSARANLRVSLANLRQVLLPLEDPLAPSPFLQITWKDVRLNVNQPQCWVDSITFDRLLAEANSHPHANILDCAECMQRLTHAINLYRGSFLSGLAPPDSPGFDEWRLFQQEAHHQQALTTLSLLATYHFNQKNYAQARFLAMRQIELEPWHEEAYRQLMQILALTGQRGSALAQYETCRRVLAEELGAEPVAETTRLYEQIKAGEIQPETPDNRHPDNRHPGNRHPGNRQATPISAPRHNLPTATTPFVGRSLELAQLTALLKNPDCHLLTVVGPGGIGKTRLVLQAAAQHLGDFKDGVYLLSLAGVDLVQTLIDTLAQALNFSFYDGPSQQTQLQHYLQEKEMLLIFDNFEYLLAPDNPDKQEAAALVVGLLYVAPSLKIMAVSRERLNVLGEWLLTIGGLGYPSADSSVSETTTQVEAIELFTQSVRRVQPNYTLTSADLPWVSKICQLVEGMPLAIELAAVWLRVISCQELFQELQHNLDFLTSSLQDAPERHRSLRAVFDYFWRRLSAEEQRIYRQLSVFDYAFDRLAAQNISGATPLDLASLGDKSLLTVTSARESGLQARYRIHNLLLRYTAYKLKEDPVEQLATHQRHSLYYLTFLQQAESKLKSGQQLEALQAIGLELKNIRQSWDWAIAHHQTIEIGRALESLFLFFYMRSWYQEGEIAFSQLVQSLGQLTEFDDYQVLRHKATVCQGWFTFHLNRKPATKALLEESLVELRKLHAPAETAFCLAHLGAIDLHLGDYDQAKQLGQECLQIYRELGDNYGAAMALNVLGQIAYLRSNLTEAELLYRESLALHREIDDQWGAAFSLKYLGQVVFSQQNYQAAQSLFEECLTIRRAVGDLRGTAQCYNYLGNTAMALGNMNQAEQLYQDALTIFKSIGHQVGIAQILANLEQIPGL